VADLKINSCKNFYSHLFTGLAILKAISLNLSPVIPLVTNNSLILALMKKVEVLKMIDSVEEIKKLDELIQESRKKKTSDFVINQYEAKKLKLIGSTITELASAPIQSIESYQLIQKILNKYYPNISEDSPLNDDDISKIATAI
jgi:NADH dehydrogenase/NADH:ubiquinone oxidoreductase subunit G